PPPSVCPPPCGSGAGGERSGVSGIPLPLPPGKEDGGQPANRDALLAWLASERNDLQNAAISIAPQIADVLRAIAALAGCRLARMSGSGSACFGLFDSARAAAGAAKHLAAAHPSWWVRAGLMGH